MAGLFDSFPINPDVPPAITLQGEESVWQRKAAKRNKRIRKLEKKRKQLRNQVAEMRKAEEQRKVEDEQKAQEKSTNSQLLLEEIVNAVVKAIPRILTTIATVFAGFYARKLFCFKALAA